LIDQLSAVGWIEICGDDPMSLQLQKTIGQDVRGDFFVGLEKFSVSPKAPHHHVSYDQQRPAISEHFNGSIQRAARAAFDLCFLCRHV
jgi:hypothetical protein